MTKVTKAVKVTIESLIARIAEIRTAEAISKKELAAFSRECLQYLVESRDVRPINMLLGNDEQDKSILSPANRRMANRFFVEFVPFKMVGELDNLVMFTEIKPKSFDKGAVKINDFLADADNNLWTWQRDNVTLETKPVDYADKLTRATKAAIEKGHISPVDALKAVIAGGVSVDALMALVDEVTAK